jgi:hypothetical protein
MIRSDVLVIMHPQYRYDDKVSSEMISSPTVSGAISRIVPVKNTNVVYIGSVNGGVWKTENINVAGAGTNVVWYPVTDQQGLGCSSIAQLTIGLNNPNWYSRPHRSLTAVGVSARVHSPGICFFAAPHRWCVHNFVRCARLDWGSMCVDVPHAGWWLRAPCLQTTTATTLVWVGCKFPRMPARPGRRVPVS